MSVFCGLTFGFHCPLFPFVCSVRRGEEAIIIYIGYKSVSQLASSIYIINLVLFVECWLLSLSYGHDWSVTKHLEVVLWHHICTTLNVLGFVLFKWTCIFFFLNLFFWLSSFISGPWEISILDMLIWSLTICLLTINCSILYQLVSVCIGKDLGGY